MPGNSDRAAARLLPLMPGHHTGPVPKLKPVVQAAERLRVQLVRFFDSLFVRQVRKRMNAEDVAAPPEKASHGLRLDRLTHFRWRSDLRRKSPADMRADVRP